MASSRRLSSRTRAGPFPAGLPNETLLRLLGRLAAGQDARAFLVGGPFRDALLGRSSPDIDIAVEGDSQRVGRAVAERFKARFVFHRRFQTGTVALTDGSHIDISRTRTETYARPAALPTITPAPVEDDLVRRDFTINALAVEITRGAFGRVLDPHSGRQDLTRRLVRVLHPRSFIDDPTRIFRAIRFAIRLGFDIEPDTLALLRSAVRGRYPARLSPERSLHELRLICAEPLVLPMIEAVLKERLLHTCFRTRPAPGFLARLQRLAAGAGNPEELFVFVLSVLPDDDQFPVTSGERDAAGAVRTFGRLRSRLARARRPSTIYRHLENLPPLALRILARIETPPVAERINLFLDRLSRVRPAVDGRALKTLGLKPGPRYRQILEAILYARLDGTVRTRRQETELARRLVRERS